MLGRPQAPCFSLAKYLHAVEIPGRQRDSQRYPTIRWLLLESELLHVRADFFPSGWLGSALDRLHPRNVVSNRAALDAKAAGEESAALAEQIHPRPSADRGEDVELQHLLSATRREHKRLGLKDNASQSAKRRHKKNMLESMDTVAYRPIYRITRFTKIKELRLRKLIREKHNEIQSLETYVIASMLRI
jgi:hypothetical protein